MKMKKILALIAALSFAVFSCKEDEKIVDPIFEFVSFRGNDFVTLNEKVFSEDGYPLLIQLWAFNPYNEDISFTLNVSATNAQKDVDFTVTPSDNIKIKSGRFFSDTIWVKTVNEDIGNDLERTFEVSISTISNTEIGIGLGATEQKNRSITFNILDDDCSGSPLCIFHTTELINAVDWGSVVEKPAVGVVDKANNTVTVSGDLIDYAEFNLTLTLTPDSPGSLTGEAFFGEQEVGEAWDGYSYKFIQTGNGTYDADTGNINIAYDIYWWDGGWWYWYSVTNSISAP